MAGAPGRRRISRYISTFCKPWRKMIANLARCSFYINNNVTFIFIHKFIRRLARLITYCISSVKIGVWIRIFTFEIKSLHIPLSHSPDRRCIILSVNLGRLGISFWKHPTNKRNDTCTGLKWASTGGYGKICINMSQNHWFWHVY